MQYPAIHQGENDLLLYPNPANETINIAFNGVGQKLYSICLFDGFGRMVLKNVTNNNKFAMNISNLQAGIYIVNVIDSKGKNYTAKFIKQ